MGQKKKFRKNSLFFKKVLDKSVGIGYNIKLHQNCPNMGEVCPFDNKINKKFTKITKILCGFSVNFPLIYMRVRGWDALIR